MQELIKLIEQWAIDRELDKSGTVEGQLIKTTEEVAELIIGISKDDIDLIKDSVGDVFVTLVIGNMLTNLKEHPYDNPIAFEDMLKYHGGLQSKSISNKYNIIKCIVNDLASIIEDDCYKVGISDLWMDLNGVCLMYNLLPIDCIESAYKEISYRKGKVINGSFVKSEDLNE